MDQKIFEDWQKSRQRKRAGGMPVTKAALGVFSLAVIGVCAFGALFATAPARMVVTVEGRVIENKKLNIKDMPVHIVLVRLSNGETTGITVPKNQPVRLDAAIKIERWRKVLGPVKIDWDNFGGYVEPAQ